MSFHYEFHSGFLPRYCRVVPVLTFMGSYAYEYGWIPHDSRWYRRPVDNRKIPELGKAPHTMEFANRQKITVRQGGAPAAGQNFG